MTSIPPRPAVNRAEFVARLLHLGLQHGDIPIYGSAEWDELPTADPRRFASVIRAAEAWRREGTDEAIRDRLLRELAENDWLCRYRIRMAGLDVRGDTDWLRVYDVVQARRKGYQPRAVA